MPWGGGEWGGGEAGFGWDHEAGAARTTAQASSPAAQPPRSRGAAAPPAATHPRTHLPWCCEHRARLRVDRAPGSRQPRLTHEPGCSSRCALASNRSRLEDAPERWRVRARSSRPIRLRLLHRRGCCMQRGNSSGCCWQSAVRPLHSLLLRLQALGDAHPGASAAHGASCRLPHRRPRQPPPRGPRTSSLSAAAVGTVACTTERRWPRRAEPPQALRRTCASCVAAVGRQGAAAAPSSSRCAAAHTWQQVARACACATAPLVSVRLPARRGLSPGPSFSVVSAARAPYNFPV